MSKLFEDIQPTVKDETKKLAIATGIMLVIMVFSFFILHQISPDSVPFDYTVILGGIGGSIVAVLNFFLMGVTIQDALDDGNPDSVKARVKSSYKYRMMMQVVWIVVAILVPFVQMAAGIIPLLFPGIWYKICAFKENRRGV